MIVNMLLRLCFSIAPVFGIAYACDCIEPSVQTKREHADMIFRGMIIELRDAKAATDLPSGWVRDTKKVAIFRVSRVWKGEGSETFEMPAVEETSMCIGFWPTYLKVGSDLIVYAKKRGSEYYTSTCGFHKPAKDAKDLEALGPGEDPQKAKTPNSK